MIETSVGPLDPDAVAAGYLRHSAELRRDDDPDAAHDPRDADTAAYDALDRIVRRGPPAAGWDLVVRVLRQSHDDELGLHAAGPLEDLVRHWGAELVDRIEAEAAGDERFRRALGGIWLSVRDLPPEVMRRVVGASGGQIRPLDADADAARDHRGPVT
jgi:hypothetical protein